METQVDGLTRRMEQQQQQLEAQENIIKQRNGFCVRVKQPQVTYSRRAPRSRRSSQREWGCWNCVQRRHFSTECPNSRATQRTRTGCPQGPIRMPSKLYVEAREEFNGDTSPDPLRDLFHRRTSELAEPQRREVADLLHR